jgi:hypothetical protein
MILKGSQRGGPRQLAAHLLNLADNDHIALHELRGFVSSDLTGAMAEADAVARGTACRQPIFSLSLNPPKNGEASIADLIDAADRAEHALGLDGQPRALVIHEKEGRRHAHVVWSRIDHEEMKAINLPFFKTRLKELSKELFLEHEWELPEGHRTNGWKNPLNFTLAEWQQARRLGLDPREVKQVFQQAWARSDNLASFRNALEEHGYYLARGDRRGVVASDINGEVYAVARWVGVRTRELAGRLGKSENLPPLESVQADLGKRVTKQLRQFIVEDRKAKQQELKPLQEALKTVVARQRKERDALLKGQDKRWKMEAAERASRFRRGLGIVLDVLTGHLFKQRKRNEAEAYAAFVRDRTQRDQLYAQHAKERAPLQQAFESMRTRHSHERRAFAVRLASVLKEIQSPDIQRSRQRLGPDHDLEL